MRKIRNITIGITDNVTDIEAIDSVFATIAYFEKDKDLPGVYFAGYFGLKNGLQVETYPKAENGRKSDKFVVSRSAENG